MKASIYNYLKLASLSAVLIFTSCKKYDLAGSSDTPTSGKTDTTATISKPTTPITATTNTTVPADATIYDLGTGSGYLTIDGSTLNLNANSFIRIKAGNYKGITIKNIVGTTAKPVFIKNLGQVNLAEGLSTDNLTNVIIDGDNTAGLTYGFVFTDIAYRAISMNGKMSGVILKSMSFKNVQDYVISCTNNNNDIAYTGSADTRTDNFKILNCLFDNVGQISFGGTLSKDLGQDTNFFKDLEIANNIFQNSNCGSLVSINNVQDYNIHNNVANNINPTTTIHSGIFFMQGNGKFHDNKLTNYEGNSIRMWLYSRGSTPATCEIYNNICYNTRKYGAFELQAFDRNMYPGKSTFANAKVYNNTVGHMNTNKDWEGQILDLYNTGGSLEYYNNLGFELFSSTKTITNMINNMSDTKITVDTNNKYVTTQQAAVSNITSFVSLFTGIGATLSL